MSNKQSSNTSRLQRLQEELTQPTIRVVLALVILFVIRELLVRIPGVDAVIYEGPGITVATVLYTVVTLVIFGAIIRYASTVGATLAQIFSEFPEVERAVQLVGALVVLAWAYQLFDWVPYFRTNPAQYDYVFLILGIGFGGWLGYILYTNVDKFSEHISNRSLDSEDSRAATTASDSSPAAVPDSDEAGTTTCPDCGTEAPRDADFCSSCGSNLASQRQWTDQTPDQT